MVSLFNKSIKDSVQIIREKIVYDGFYQVKKVTFRHHLFKSEFDNDWIKPVDREVVMWGRSVVAVLLFDPVLSQFGVIEQFRIGAFMANDKTSSNESQDSPWLLEIAGGMVDAEESLEAAAYREAKEETGLTIEKLLPIGDYWANPTITSEKIMLFCGKVSIQDKTSTHGLLADGEDIRMHAIGVQEAYQYLEQGKIKSAPALIALQWFKLHEEKVRQLMH